MNCTIPGCPNEATAHGLCAKHYMRLRRHGDPNVEIRVGRQPKPKPPDPELDAVKRENAALREQVQALTRERDEARAKGGAAMLLDRLAAIVKEREAKGLAMSKRDRKLRAAIHPDRARDEAERKRLDQASQIFNALPIFEIDGG